MSEIWHYGIKGMRWGVRRFQNKDGSLTRAGKERYGEACKREEEQHRQVVDAFLDGYKKFTQGKISEDELFELSNKVDEYEDHMRELDREKVAAFNESRNGPLSERKIHVPNEAVMTSFDMLKDKSCNDEFDRVMSKSDDPVVSKAVEVAKKDFDLETQINSLYYKYLDQYDKSHKDGWSGDGSEFGDYCAEHYPDYKQLNDAREAINSRLIPQIKRLAKQLNIPVSKYTYSTKLKDGQTYTEFLDPKVAFVAMKLSLSVSGFEYGINIFPESFMEKTWVDPKTKRSTVSNIW